MSVPDFERAIDRLDLDLFSAIDSESSDNDKRSLLACQRGMRSVAAHYAYLEVGSHRGGSLQPYLLDPRCRRMFSIDKRTAAQPDARGVTYRYPDNSTARMLDALTRLSDVGVRKLVCIDADATRVAPDRIDPKPLLCFIDAEHTDRAVFDDCQWCRRVLAPNGVIVLHDAPTIYLGLSRIIADLEAFRVQFRAYHLPDQVFVIEFDECRLHETPPVRDMLVNNHVGYLAALGANDHFRAFALNPVFRYLRMLKASVLHPRARR